MDLFEFMEDFDNAELSEEDWQEQMVDAVISYNEEYDTQHIPTRAIKLYKNWVASKNEPDI